jgi:hypothetical protein
MTKQTIGISLLLCLMGLFGSTPVMGQTPAPACIEPVHWQALMQELRNLRIELLQEKILRTDARIDELQQQLQRAEAERNSMHDLERSQAEEIAEFQSQLSRPGLSPHERAELEKNHFLMRTTGATQLAEHKSAAAAREAELRRQLSIQQQYRVQLMDMLRAFDPATSR